MTSEDKLAQLRKKWEENPGKREIIELQARIIKSTMKKGYITQEQREEAELAVNVTETLL